MMPQSMLQLVKETLREDERLTSEGKLLKNKIMELALKQDPELIELLMDNDRIREHFFNEVNGTLVFDKGRFIKFVNNKQFLPDSFTTFKNKIGLTSDGEYLDRKKDVSLSWPYKDCVLEGGQADPDEERAEIFWNETLAPDEVDRLLDPKVLTNFRRVDEEGEETNPKLEKKDNLLIEGNNLLALHSLVHRFSNEVKLIYIDPPYNIGREFNYNDKFKHSTWLTFMKNRLEVAKNLLRYDGSVWINLDDTEAFYCKILCDEVFGRDNFVGTIIWEKSDSPRMDASYFSVRHDYILVYAKEKNEFNPNREKQEEVPDH